MISSVSVDKMVRSLKTNQGSALKDALLASELRYRRLFETANIRDITGRKSAENALIISENRLRTLVQTITGPGFADIIEDEEDHHVNNLKILVVENDKPSEKLLSIAVKKIAREVLSVSTGLDAVTACHNNPDIDLVLMDIKMPVMDGYEATREIRKFNRKVVIIAQTAYALVGDREMAIEAGCDDYISKPINKVLLNKLILKHF